MKFETFLKTRHKVLISSALIFCATMGSTVSAADVVARVNGQDITSADVDIAGKLYAGSAGSMPTEARLSMLVDALIEFRVVADAAKVAGFDQDADYKRQVALLQEQVLRTMFVEKSARSMVKDQMVKDTYDVQVAKIPRVDEVRVRHILLPTENEALAALQAVKDGAAFEVVAAERSKDETAKTNGGDLGYALQEQLLPEIVQAVSKLKPGETASAPVKTSFGFYVVKLEDRRARPLPPFAAVSGQIRGSLENDAASKIIANLKSKATIEKLVPDVAPPAEADGHDHSQEQPK